MSTKSRTTTATAAILAAAAIAAPSASAYTLAGGGSTGANHGSAPVVVRTVEPQSSGFDWGDASIGAGAVTLLGLGAGGALVARRTRRSHAPAS
jgi:hypothetical protein